MIPKIDLGEGKEYYTRREVEEMIDSLSNAMVGMYKNELTQFKFAKRISYLCLIVAILVLGKSLL